MITFGMSAAQMPLPARISAEEYLRLERESEFKHEFVDGAIYAMAGVRRAHDRITANLHGILYNKFRGGPCQNFTADIKVRSELANRFYYPDVSALCGEAEFLDDQTDVLLNPALIVEVLSKSTERTDRSEKFPAYRLIPSFEEYVLVSQWEHKAEVFRRVTRDEWSVEEITGLDAEFELKSVGATVKMAELFENVTLTEREDPESR